MKHLITLLAILALISIAILASAEIPRYMQFQGKLTDNEDVPVNGTRLIWFRIYDAAEEGQLLWDKDRNVPIENGVFSVRLGEEKPLDLSFDVPYWISIQVEGDEEMDRQPITSGGYAYRAKTVDDLVIESRTSDPADPKEGQIWLNNGQLRIRKGGATHAIPLVSPMAPTSKDLLNEDCSDFSAPPVNWDNLDSGSGIHEVDPQGQWHFRTTNEYGKAYIYNKLGPIPDDYTVEIRLKLDAVGANDLNSFFRVEISNGLFYFDVMLGSDGLYTLKGRVPGITVETGEWHTWRFVVTGGSHETATCDIYMDSSLEATDVDVSANYFAGEGFTHIIMQNDRDEPMATECHIDWIGITSGKHGYSQ